ncbi:hypothetical protein KJ564_10345 [bacterium]|nr:hypothetical protein [bacterium]MBU1882336.1 hypothetical protein [bacterium]
MTRMRFYYLDAGERRQLEDLVQGLLSKSFEGNVFAEIKTLLPIIKWDQVSLRKHVEGMFYVSERLWTVALETGKAKFGGEFNRINLLRITKIKSMSYYSYMTGSRDPVNIMMTRDDVLQDPAISMIKMKDDISALLQFVYDSPQFDQTVTDQA